MYIIKRTVKPYYLYKQIHYVALFSVFLITSKHIHTRTHARTHTHTHTHTHTQFHSHTHIYTQTETVMAWPILLDENISNLFDWMDTDGHHTADIPSNARLAHNGLLQNRMEDDLCWMVPHVSLKTWLVEGLSEYDIHIAQGFCFDITAYKHMIYF